MYTHCEETERDGCEQIPSFERVCYYAGQLLGPKEFTDEHQFFADKIALVVSKLIGHGVVCGLDVNVEIRPVDPCAPPGQDVLERVWVTIAPGIAVDCNGQLLVVRRAIATRIWDLLCASQRDLAARLTDGQRPPLYVALRFEEMAAQHSRPIRTDSCSLPGGRQVSRVRECVDVIVSLDPPTSSRCDECCHACADADVLLAVLQQHVDDCNLVGIIVDESTRREFGRTRLTTISGITWVHGGLFEADTADELFTNGIGIRFSAPVLIESLADPAIVDLVVHAGGRGNADSFVPRSVDVLPGKPDVTNRTTSELWIRYDGDDELSPGDLVRITVRCDFILDLCCRAVDGNHIGGRVPVYTPSPPHEGWKQIPPSGDSATPTECQRPPSRPWTSGNGTQGGSFESWIRVPDRKKGAK